MGMKLFDDDENENIDVSKIEIDDKFARRYVHNKKREDLQRYEELKKKGQIEDSESDSESSESEEDDAEIKKLSKKKSFKEFFNNLIKVKERDPSIYKKDVKLFESDSDTDTNDDDSKGENEMRDGKKKKAVYLKDVRAQQLIEEGPEFEEGESSSAKRKTYTEEQEELKRAFLEAVKDAADVDGDLLRVKEKDLKEEDDGNDVDFEEKLQKYFGAEEELDENNKFLKEFIEKQMWVDRDNKDRSGVADDEVDDLFRDDEEIERQEKYEETYNFRHEESVGDRVMGHSRIVEGSVRKKENARKEQRKSKKERMEIAEMERKAELKHLKNLKKKEMNEKLSKVMQAAGVTDDNDFALDLDDLKKDFDPEEYDKMMKKAFNEDYYNADDLDPEFGSENDDDGVDIKKPDFDKEDELLGLPKGWDAVDNEGFLALRERILEQKAENGNGDDEKGEENEETNRESKRKRKRKMSLVQKVKEEWLEEYYKLDYEGTVGDLKTRFKYAKVQPERYGLKTEEILMLDDQELNQYVSVKKLAPYRDSEWKVHKNRKDQLKEKIKELRRGGLNHQKNSKKNKLKDDSDKSTLVVDSHKDGKEELEGQNVQMENLSRKAKRKRRQAELKLTLSRTLAYQNAQSKAKGKGKH
ncbi:Trichohyalin, putative [Ricinus communis]|uniref:Trichohyalin, putative n=2 Tax=Ricinus communis TaxID=3988 RepID=B9RM59_RICCO|nr:Trichohyalin, putative [Ricinus communis]|eukprot:XP_002514828.1 protein KRI1 homolog [Ricinus communis]